MSFFFFSIQSRRCVVCSRMHFFKGEVRFKCTFTLQNLMAEFTRRQIWTLSAGDLIITSQQNVSIGPGGGAVLGSAQEEIREQEGKNHQSSEKKPFSRLS